MDDRLNILCQSSDSYCPFCGVMLESLFFHNVDIETINVYLISDGIQNENLKKIDIASKKHGRKIEIIDGKMIGDFLKKNSIPLWRESYATYYKLFIEDSISEDIDKLIYLDSDILINDSLRDLLNIDMHGNVLGMVIDIASETHKKNIGYPAKNYYNCGVILFDFKKWRTEKCARQMLQHMKTIHANYPIADQDIINLVMQGKVETIDLRYNLNTDILVYKEYSAFKAANGVKCYYTENEFVQAKKNPIIYHLFGSVTTRPWVKNSNHPLSKLWDEYLVKSPWKDYVKSEEKPNYLIRIQRKLFKILPTHSFSKINKFCTIFLQNLRAKKSGLR